MAIVHQSDLSSWARCPASFGYQRAGLPRKQLSATAYGSVIHHALQVFERARHNDGLSYQQAVDLAVETFVYYWNPLNISEICEPVDEWIARDTMQGLHRKGIETLRAWCEMIRDSQEELLATEYSFIVPIDGTWDYDLGEPHVLAGSIDRFSLKYLKRTLVVETSDYKSGREYKYLRHNLQFTAYSYATTKREFWVGWRGEDGFGPDRGEELHQRTLGLARHGTWINLKKSPPEMQDAGYRGPQDYARFAVAVDQVMASIAADIFPLQLKGDVCEFCEYQRVCGGVGVPDKDHGAPLSL